MGAGVGDIPPPPPRDSLSLRLLLPLSGLILKCSERPLTFSVISNTGPDNVICHLSSRGCPVYHSTSRFTEIHLVIFSPLFPLMALLSKFTKPTHNQISAAPREADSPVRNDVVSCCGLRNRTRCSTADNYQRLMIPADCLLISLWQWMDV
jgi:hypothetical protein